MARGDRGNGGDGPTRLAFVLPAPVGEKGEGEAAAKIVRGTVVDSNLVGTGSYRVREKACGHRRTRTRLV